jgi:hypothetical protein
LRQVCFCVLVLLPMSKRRKFFFCQLPKAHSSPNELEKWKFGVDHKLNFSKLGATPVIASHIGSLGHYTFSRRQTFVPITYLLFVWIPIARISGARGFESSRRLAGTCSAHCISVVSLSFLSKQNAENLGDIGLWKNDNS